jgi:hypothetical protein
MRITQNLTGSGHVFFEGEGGGTTPPAPGGDTPPSGDSGPWYQSGGVAAEHHDWLRNKEFADINTAITSHKSLEQLVGRQRLAVPKDANDAAAYDALYKTLGRPADAKGYKQPDGIKIEDKAWERFSGVFHKHGIGQAQAEAIVKEYYAFGTEGKTATDSARQVQEAVEEAELKKAWGKDFDANTDIAGRAWRALGMSEETSNKIEAALGFKAFTEFFHKIGAGMSEASMKTDSGTGNGMGSGAQAVEQAKSRRDAMLADPEFLRRYQNSNQAVRNKAIEEIQPYIKLIAEAKDAARAAGKEF